VALVVWFVAWAWFGLPWTGATRHAHWDNVRFSMYLTPRTVLDAALNVVFYVPFGVLAVAAGVRGAFALACGAALSATTELTQVFSHTRVPSAIDFVLNSAGSLLGALLHARLVRRASREAEHVGERREREV
jgi:glycopeptide antibiotics resistance protein